ncbi:translocation/assembly module TamB domain-containing protein [Sphingomonas sp. BT-65]|uniref:translocation/assembly module TamB domain-containing protein n=1 Tax=Sphingomonas sp. BT-65 TaxID=2989821 RepID=UPI002236BCF9|nr:translocation/assembly module TamB domain-containing protein [Sphingomonas sp. BT-65]MCW4463597.1 translocation/assembly module TamB domain-containing protein [Sphingomonas sp. BT-65]
MAEQAASTETVIVPAPAWQRVAKWVLIALVGIAALLLLAILGLNTSPGKRLVADQLGKYTTATGLNVKVGRIEGSIYGAMVLRDVRVSDTKGVFATSPSIAVDWRPFAFLNNHVDIRSATSPLVTVARLPAFKPGDPNASMLPDIDIDIGRLAIDRLVLEPPVAGRRHVATLSGEAAIADRRARVIANARTLGTTGGDRLALVLDAVPDDDKFDLRADLDAPVGGLVAGLAKLEAPLAARISGRGSWANWQGRAVSTLGGAELADLDITARKGTFQVRGTAQPGLYLKGPVERLAAPNVQVALDATLDQRRADTRLRLRSSAMALATTGTIDLGKSAFDQFRIEAALLTPGAIAPNLNGRSVIGAVALNGPFATPTVDYKLQAAAIGFGTTVLERVYAEGLATVNADRILVPIRARAARVSGLNQAAGGLLTNVTLAGDLAITGPQILSENLRIRSDRIDATAIIAANVATGRYTGALKGRVNDYTIDGIGIVNLETDADLYAAAGGGWGIKGRIVGRSTRLFNSGVRDFLGGNAILRVNVGLDPSGIITFDNLRLAAPQFKILRGSGRYDPTGPLLLNADGYSNAYGPVFARVTGSLTAPIVNLRAPRPGLGVGLANLEARIRGQGDAYAVVASGGTSYGPFTADVLVRTGRALTVDVRKARFAGTDITGKLQQTAAGPFAGALAFVGSGINGNVDLSAQGKYQQAVVRATATNAQIPGDMEITIGRAIVNATVVLYDDAPSIVGEAQVANLKSGEFVLARSRAKIDYRGGRGTAQAFAEGSSGVPFRVAANARFAPDQWLVALGGKANNIDFKTAQPARIAVSDNSYRLAPVQIDFDRGSARLAGSWGEGLVVQARLDKLDLSVANAFSPGLGVGGNVTGSIDFRQARDGSFPRAITRLNIAGFNRSSLAGVSPAVDIAFVGRLLPEGGDARAVIKRGTTTIGRMVATLQPLGSGGSWNERLMAAPLSGGVRYNGPSAVLFSLAGFSNQSVSGPVAVAADFSGQLRSPQITGQLRAEKLVYENETWGTRLTQMKIEGRFDSDTLEITEMNAVAGAGRVIASGTVGLSAAQGFPIDITARFRNARLARSDALGATATGQLHITNGLDGGLIEGRIIIPEARYQIIRQGAAEVPELTGVYRKSELDAEGKRPVRAKPAGIFRLNVAVVADNRLFVNGMGLESEWEARMQVTGTSAAPIVTGEARVVRGTYNFASRRFELTRGTINFEGGPLANPSINIAASTTAENVTAIINITGTGQAPRIAFSSTPSLPQDEVLSRLLFGSSVTNLSATEAIQLAAALNSLRASGGGLNPLGQLRSAAGIDRLRILGEDDTTGRGMALAAGQYLTDDIYVEIITDARGYTAVQLEIALTRALSLLSQTGSFGGSRAGLKYSKDY